MKILVLNSNDLFNNVALRGNVDIVPDDVEDLKGWLSLCTYVDSIMLFDNLGSGVKIARQIPKELIGKTVVVFSPVLPNHGMGPYNDLDITQFQVYDEEMRNLLLSETVN